VSGFLQQLSNGIVLGATYGLVALGYTMVYGIIQLINFAHGEVVMIGAFGGLATYHYLPLVPDDVSAWIGLPLVMVGAIACSVLVAVLMERLAYRPLRNAPRLAPLITAIGVSIALQEIVRLFYPVQGADRPFSGAKTPQPFPQFITGDFEIGGVQVEWVSVFVVVAAIGLMLALSTFVRQSRTGKAMQATAQDPDTARLMGIDTDRIIVIAFVLGAILAGVAGVFQGLRFGIVDFRLGFLAGLKAFTAAVLGGIGNIAGAVLGGFVLGMVEVMATAYIPGQFGGNAWKDVWAFVVLIVVLVFRPAGLLGERVATRA
jgi:branched-chain amino acid transport system permease protein